MPATRSGGVIGDRRQRGLQRSRAGSRRPGPGQTVDNTSGACLGGAPCFGNSTPPLATCSLFLQLNYINGFKQFGPFQSVQRSDNAGATDQLFGALRFVRAPEGAAP